MYIRYTTNFNTESKHISFSSSLIQLPAENNKQNKVKKFSSVFIESFKKNSKSLEQLNIFNFKSKNFYYFSYLYIYTTIKAFNLYFEINSEAFFRF